MVCKAYVGYLPVAQGELLIRKVDKLPEGLKVLKSENERFIIGHSESGHHHVVKQQENVVCYSNDNDPMSLYLVVNNPKEECFLDHERNFDTHAPFFFGDGIYHVRRQIESTPKGFVRVAD